MAFGKSPAAQELSGRPEWAQDTAKTEVSGRNRTWTQLRGTSWGGGCLAGCCWCGGCLASRWGLGGGSVGPVRGSERRVFASEAGSRTALGGLFGADGVGSGVGKGVACAAGCAAGCAA